MLEYFGKIEAVKEEIETYRHKLINAYKETLGEHLELADKMSQELLVPSSTLGIGGGATPIEDNSFFYVSFDFKGDVVVDSNGRVHPNRTVIKPHIHLSEHSIELGHQSQKYRDMPKYLTPFLHEYNHFILFCLQECPDVLAGYIGWQKANEEGKIDRQNPTQNLIPEQLKWMRIYGHHFCVSEVTQDFLTASILKKLGFDIKGITEPSQIQQYFSKYRIYDDESLLDFAIHWNQRIQYFDRFQRNFFRSLDRIVVERKSMS